MKTEFVPRVNQLDALQLDQDIVRIVRDQLISAIQNISPALLHRLNPEIDLILRAAIWNFSVRMHSASFGQRLLFITYDREQLSKSFNLYKHFFVNIFLAYIRDNITYRWTEQHSLQKCVTIAEGCIAIGTLLNFFRFLNAGKRPSLSDYILGLDNISMYGNRRREIGYSHMTRELIWGGFMELLGFTLPLVNYHSVKRKCRSIFSVFMEPPSFDPNGEERKPLFTANTKCAFCDERPSLPHHMGCCHVFCYYCLKGNLMADPQFECPTCQLKNEFIKPL